MTLEDRLDRMVTLLERNNELLEHLIRTLGERLPMPEGKGTTVDKPLLTVVECAELTGLSTSGWRKAIARKAVPYVRLGRSIRIPRDYIEQMIKDGYREVVSFSKGEIDGGPGSEGAGGAHAVES